jgi:uridine phosphorylase|tara:strand:+ start:1175 stop:2023 length:849 start_codon:yes stop_codon:yes gene_type:complete
MDRSELILNKDGSVYHLKLKSENLSSKVILVGDPFRVDKITKHFDKIEFKTQNREFKSVTGYYKSKRITVVSTGIGSANIDIVLNELDALVNINLETGEVLNSKKSLNLIRIGTSGAIQDDVPVDSFLLSKMAIDIDGFMLNYDLSTIDNKNFTKHIYENHQIQDQLYCYDCSSELYDKFNSNDVNSGITITCSGFYSSQGRSIRLSASHKNNLSEIKKIKYNNYNATNLEMETAIIYAMSKLLGHKAISLNAILANRNLEEYSMNPENTVENLIEYTLNKL